MSLLPAKKPEPVREAAPVAAASPAKKTVHRDPVREVFETLVFVVALVLMLKLFAVEAFVIPTGSMAETLYGYQYVVTCDECKHEFPVNAANEGQPRNGVPLRPKNAVCPNCRYHVEIKTVPAGGPAYGSGDRVLVHKGMYHVDDGPTRGDVVVFKYPVDPQVVQEAQNYIKRLWGLGGETIAVWRGDLYVTKALTYPKDERHPDGRPNRYPRPDDPLKQWEGRMVRSDPRLPYYRSQEIDFTYHNADAALELFEKSRQAGFPVGVGGFEPVRKTDAQALAMRRIVYDNDHQSPRLTKAGVPPRWSADGPGWSADGPAGFSHAGEQTFLRYRHRVGETPAGDQDDWKSFLGGKADGLFAPAPITNLLGYNSGDEAGRSPATHWVGDLMLEVTADLTGPDAGVVLELSRGLYRYQASFTKGEVVLNRVGLGGKEMARKPSGVTTGKHRLRFANVDSRLRVWVDGTAIDFGPAADYTTTTPESTEPLAAALAGGVFAPRPDGHTLQNDILSPAAVGVSGTARVGALKLWNDTYFTPTDPHGFDDQSDKVDTFYVHPEHYLCLGDNSSASSDGRTWGLVPERLMLGKACFVFFPANRVGFIR